MSTPDPNTPIYADYTNDAMHVADFLVYVIVMMLIDPPKYVDPYATINLDWAHDVIPGLDIGAIDSNGTVKQLTFPIGPIYDSLAQIATDQHLGIKLYLESAAANDGYALRLAFYRGVDRTSDQDQTRLIRMSPDMDSLLSSKEFVSAEKYKNVVYVLFKNEITQHFAKDVMPLDFRRRDILVIAPDAHVKPERIAAYREQVAWNTLIQHGQISAVDGQLQTVSGHKFTRDYFLGDVIELVGTNGVSVMAQVTEHIRSQDQSGFKEYPTVSIIDPLLFNLSEDMAAPEPDRDWVGDPVYQIDPPPAPRFIFNYSPDIDQPEVVGGVTGLGHLKKLWDNDQTLTPLRWTPDRVKLVVRSMNQIYVGDSFQTILTFWLMSANGLERDQLGSELVNVLNDGTEWDLSNVGIWADSNGPMHVYAAKSGTNIDRSVDIWHRTATSAFTVFLAASSFSTQERTIFPALFPSPDDTKLYFTRRAYDPTTSITTTHQYLVNSDATGLHELALGLEAFGGFFDNLIWNEDSTKLYAIATADMYIVVDVATSANSYYTIRQQTDASILKIVMSPDSTKIAWVESLWVMDPDTGDSTNTDNWLYVGSLDGTSPTLLYHQTADFNGHDSTKLFLQRSGHADFVWNFDGTKLAVVDAREASPIWVFDVVTGESEIAYSGHGLRNPDVAPRIFNPMMFDE